MIKNQDQPCPHCGLTMALEVRVDDLVYRGIHSMVLTKAWWCACGEYIFDSATLLQRETRRTP